MAVVARRSAVGVLLLVALASACTREGPPAGPAAVSPGRAQWTPYVGARPVNVAALRSLSGRVRCAPKEVAPGTWAAFDCGPQQEIARAVAGAPRMQLVSGPLPPFVDHRLTGLEGPVKAQGAVGACTAFSLSTAMDHAIRRAGVGDVVAPLHIWSKYGVPNMGAAGDRTADETITTEAVWPYDPAKACKLTLVPFDACGSAYSVQSGTGVFDKQLQAERKIADKKGRFRVSAIEKLSKPVDTDELAAVLAGGDDVWASFWVDSEAWSDRSLQAGVIPDYERREDEGHAVVLSGYRPTPSGRQFLVHNSWGARWGDGGYGWLSEAMVRKHLKAAFKVRVADTEAPGPTPIPGPAPAPAPAPAPSGCATGQTRDAVTGQCANVCPSGSAPAAGVCLPSIPGFPPALPGPAPAPSVACPAGQAPDLMTGQCFARCAGGNPSIGGMCLPGM